MSIDGPSVVPSASSYISKRSLGENMRLWFWKSRSEHGKGKRGLPADHKSVLARQPLLHSHSLIPDDSCQLMTGSH